MSASETHEERGPHPAINIWLIAVGAAALGVLLYFNGRFGWSLGTTWGDSVGYTVLHVLADLASAGLVAWSASIAAKRKWRWRMRAWAAFLCALAFTSVSILTVYGFMSTRMAAVAGHTAVLETQKDHAKWLAGQTVKADVANAYAAAARECATGRGPLCAAAEARAKALAGQQSSMRIELRQQFKTIEATASIVPDSHALAIAGATGLSLATVQKLLMLIMSAFGQSVKFACLFFGIKGWVAHRMSTVSRTVPSTSEGGGGTSVKGSQPLEPSKRNDETVAAKPGNVTPLRKAERPVVELSPELPRLSLPEYLKQHAGVTYASQTALAKATGFSPATVSRELKRLEGRRKVKRSKHKRGANAVTYGGHGGLQAAV